MCAHIEIFTLIISWANIKTNICYSQAFCFTGHSVLYICPKFLGHCSSGHISSVTFGEVVVSIWVILSRYVDISSVLKHLLCQVNVLVEHYNHEKVIVHPINWWQEKFLKWDILPFCLTTTNTFSFSLILSIQSLFFLLRSYWDLPEIWQCCRWTDSHSLWIRCNK